MLGDPMVDACEPVAQESVGSHVLPRRLYSSLCNQTRTLCWSSRVAREIVFQPLQSDTDALLNQPCCLGDCIPGEIVFQPLQSDTDAPCAKRVRCSYFFWWHEGRLSLDSVVHKLMDAMSSPLKLRSDGLTPHFHAERSSNGSCGSPLPVRSWSGRWKNPRRRLMSQLYEVLQSVPLGRSVHGHVAVEPIANFRFHCLSPLFCTALRRLISRAVEAAVSASFPFSFSTSFCVFWRLSFLVQTESNTRGRTTSTGAPQYHCVGQALQVCHCWRAFRALGTGVRRESSKASGLRPESCFLPSRVPASLSWDSRWKVAPCSRVVCLTGLFVVGDQFRHSFHSRVVDSIPLIGVSRLCVH